MHHKSASVAAIVLAAGLSRRMGTLKALLPVGGLPLVVHVVQNLSASRGIDQIYIVTGHACERVAAALSHCDHKLVHNPGFAAGGMLSSVQAGVSAAGGHDAFVIAPVDQPMVQRQTIEGLVGAWRRSGAAVVRPRHDNRHGHPILIDARGRDRLLSLPLDSTLKHYIRAHAEQTLDVDVDDPAILDDIDTPADYVRAMRRWVEQQRSVICHTSTPAMAPALAKV